MSFDWLRRVRQGMLSVTRSSAATRPRQARRELALAVAAEVQRLEPRMLLSATPVGPEFRVNSFTTNHQNDSSVAMDADGDFVVAWESTNQDGSGHGIFARRYDGNGIPQGSDLQVNTFTTSHQFASSVAMDADGDFVVTWTSPQDGGGGASGEIGIYAQRYNAAGMAQGGEFRVNSQTAERQVNSSVAMDADGDFVVTWQSYGQDGSAFGIYGQRFSANGVAQGSEFRVNTHTTNDQQFSSVAMDADGDFVVAWQSYDQDGSSVGIYAQRYNSVGIAQGSEFRVNSHTTAHQEHPAVALDSNGDFVVAWQSYGQDGSNSGIYAQRFNAAGVVQGSEFRVNTFTTGYQTGASVAMDVDGDFAIVWNTYQDGSEGGIYAQYFNAAGVAQGGEFRVNTHTTNEQVGGPLAMDADGDFVVTWVSEQQDSLSSNGIYAQRYRVGSDTTPPVVTDLVVAGDVLEVGEQIVVPPASITVRFTEQLSTAGGMTGPASVTNLANWALLLNGIDVSNQISGITFGFNMDSGQFEAVVNFTVPLAPGDYELILHDAVTDLEGNPLDGDESGMAGGDFVRAVRVRDPQPLGPTFVVNTFTSGSKVPNGVAMDADGDFVVTWTSNSQLDASGDVYARRYLKDGTPLGGEFRVNTTTFSEQRNSAVAMDTAGNFVIVWTSRDNEGSGEGIYAQRFAADGSAAGGEFHVNIVTTGDQVEPTVAMDADGDFVIGWNDNGVNIKSRLFDSDGTPQSGEITVNSTAPFPGIQHMPDVAIDGDGDFVVTWTSNNEDGSATGIFAQRFSANGTPQGVQFRVNTFTTNDQNDPAIAMDESGDFVIAWKGHGPAGAFYGVYAQRYSADGTSLGDQFRLGSFAPSGQEAPNLAMDADGDFAALWSGDGFDGPGTYVRRFAADGTPQGVETRVFGQNDFGQPIAMDRDGDFVVVGDLSDVNAQRVGAQRFGGGETPTAFDIAVSTNEDVTINGGLLWAFDPDTPIDQLTYAITSPTIHGTLTQTGVRGFNYTPNLEFSGADSFTFTVSDGQLTSAPATVNITVNPINDTPTAFDLQLATNEDTAINGGLLWAFDPETPTNSLTYNITNPTTHGTVTQTGVRGFNYVPNANFFGTDSFQFTASDGNTTSAPATVTIAVDPVNDTPTAFDIQIATNEDTPSNGNLLWAFDVETPMDNLAYAITNAADHGTVTQTGVRSFNYAPNANFAGTDAFQFTASDGQATALPATVTITVNPINDAPIAFDLDLTTSEDTAIIGGLLWGFDPETPVDNLTYTITGAAAHGTVAQTGVRSFNYTPNPEFSGSDSFVYSVSDGQSTSLEATVSIDVTPVQDAPVASDLDLSIDEDTPLTNGLLWGFDPETPVDNLTYNVTNFPIHGTLTRSGVRGFDYVPDADFNGVDSFQYTVSDGETTSAPATVTIAVNAVNDVPTAFDLAVSMDEDTSIEGGLLWAFDVETPIDSLTFTVTSLTMNGTITQTGVRSFNYTPDANFNGVDSFQFTVSDGQATSAAATVTITVNPAPLRTRQARKTVVAG